MRYVLDTDTCIDVLRHLPTAWSRVQAASPDELAVASMTLAELRYGALLSRAPIANLARIDAFLGDVIEFVPFDESAAVHHAEIRESLRRQPISERDLVIAATTRANGFILVTRNLREFQRIPELNVESWN